MKKSRLLIIGLILLSFNIKMLGQEDTVIIENSTEPIKQSDFKQKRKYKYLDNNYREEKTLLKIEIPPMNYTDQPIRYIDLNINFGFEQKLGRSFSLLFDNSIVGQYLSNSPYNYWGWSNDLGFRYYYSMNKRVSESLGVNNFHSNYFSIKMDDWLMYLNYSEFTFNPILCISWGMQRRIGKIGIVDVGPYFKYKADLKYQPGNYEIGLNLLIGFAWGFKK